MGNQSETPGLGTTLSADGVIFRVWAPHAKQVSVVGIFNGWNGEAHPLAPEDGGTWRGCVGCASVGDHYKYQLTTERGVITRIDPHAREVTSSVGNAIIHDPNFDWGGDDFPSHHGVSLSFMNCMLALLMMLIPIDLASSSRSRLALGTSSSWASTRFRSCR